MTKTLSEQVEQLEKELAEVKVKLANEVKVKLANEAKKKPVTVGFEEPERGELYWFVAGGGNIHSSIYSHHPINDSRRLSMGKVFLTEADAKKKQSLLKTLAELKRMTNGFAPRTASGWYEISVSSDRKNIEIVFIKKLFAGDIPRYSTKEEAQAAVDSVGVDRIKELMEV